MTHIDVNAISDGLEACRCSDLQRALDDVGEAAYATATALAAAESEVVRLRSDLEVAEAVNGVLADLCRQVTLERDNALALLDVAYAECAGEFAA